MTDETGAAPAAAPSEIKDFDAEHLAALVGSAKDEDLAAGMADEQNRKAVLDEIFRRMADHVEPSKARGADAIVHFRIGDRADGGHDVYEVTLKEGNCTVTDEPAQSPRVTLSAGIIPFLKLVTGNAAGPMLFMSGKLKIEGDLMFAATMTSLFRIPKAAAPPQAASEGSSA
jgi:putative sterol carrier protein